MSTAASRHRDLDRLLRRLRLSTHEVPTDPVAWHALLDAVSRAYEQADDERYTLERSIQVSSQEMRALHDTLSHRACHDTLTGLPNRAALKEILRSTLASHRVSGHSIAVLFIDLDGFKRINDGLGHAVGDELLVRAAERIRSTIRPDDVVARLGGDEFIVLCPLVDDVDVAVAIARRICQQLEIPFRLSTEEAASVSASIGIALADHATSPDELIGNADLAMYAAKAQGRACFLIFDDAMRARADERLTTENALRQAADNGELLVHFQPIVGLVERRAVGAEALVRWDRPGRGLQQAGSFIPAAEHGRLITAVDTWVLAEACRQAASWPDERLGVAVNLSARDVHSDQFVPRVAAALDASGLDAQRLTLELSENAVMSDAVAMATALAKVTELGVGLAVDDFGPGYWSIEHLRRLPARALKLHPSLSAGIGRDPASAAVLAALIDLGHAIGLEVVAEGVERPEQAALLAQLGCDAAQGFLFGRPRPGVPTWR